MFTFSKRAHQPVQIYETSENPPNTENWSSWLFSQDMQLTIQVYFFKLSYLEKQVGQSEKKKAMILCGNAQVQLDWRRHSDL